MDESMALVAAVALFGLPIAGWIVVRGMEHTERMEMIRRGMIPPPYGIRAGPVPPGVGLLVPALFSVALLAAAWLIGFSSIVYPPRAQPPPYALAVLAGIAFVPLVAIRALRRRSIRRLRALPPSDDS